MLYRADTIVACATAPGRGAVAIVRCSGREALAVADRIFRPKSASLLQPWRLRLGTVLSARDGSPIDEALGVYFPARSSYTGEETFEIHCHGGPVVVEQVLASAISAGARGADRGEFTRRAVLNGKLDLLQAEAIADLIDARMAAGTAAAWKQLQGALSREFAEIRASLVSVLAEIEAGVDFSDDELPEADFAQRGAAIAAVIDRVAGLLAGFAASRRQREGIRVVFTGRPNAGKSSLVNRLLGTGRMIVSEEAGTTRDVVEESVEIEGIAFVLTDTAGLRSAIGQAEAEAVKRARLAMEEADLRILVIDASAKDFTGEEQDLWAAVAGPDTIVVLNKQDLAAGISPELRSGLAARGCMLLDTSARTGAGCPELADAIVSAARSRMETDAPGISRVRHRTALEKTLVALERGRTLAFSEGACELAAEEIRYALGELAGITEAVDSEEVLDRIFSEFCIGK